MRWVLEHKKLGFDPEDKHSGGLGESRSRGGGDERWVMGVGDFGELGINGRWKVVDIESNQVW